MKAKYPPQLQGLPAATLLTLQQLYSGECALRVELSVHNPMTQNWDTLRGHRRIVRGGTPEQVWRLVQNVGNYIDTWVAKEKEKTTNAIQSRSRPSRS